MLRGSNQTTVKDGSRNGIAVKRASFTAGLGLQRHKGIAILLKVFFMSKLGNVPALGSLNFVIIHGNHAANYYGVVDTYNQLEEHSAVLGSHVKPLNLKQSLRPPRCPCASLHLCSEDIVTLRKFTADEFSHLHTVLEQMCSFMAGTWADFWWLHAIMDSETTGGL